MATMKLIEQHVKDKLNSESSGHDYLHAKRVVKNCMLFINDYDVDEEVVIASAWIHDLIDHKLSEEFKSTEEEIEFLLKYCEFSAPQITRILDTIHNISYSKGNIPKSVEGKIVQDADRLDALGAIGIARTFAFGGKKGRLIYSDDENDTLNSVAHFYEKLYKLPDLMNTKKGKSLGIERVKFMKSFMDVLDKETK